MTREEQLMQIGEVLMDRPHPDGGSGLRLIGLPDRSLLIKLRDLPAKIIPRHVIPEVVEVLTAWRERIAPRQGETLDPTQPVDPSTGPVMDE